MILRWDPYTHEPAIWTVVTILLCFQAWWYQRQPIRPSDSNKALPSRASLCERRKTRSLCYSMRSFACKQFPGRCSCRSRGDGSRGKAHGQREEEGGMDFPSAFFLFWPVLFDKRWRVTRGSPALGSRKGNTEGGSRPLLFRRSSFLVHRCQVTSSQQLAGVGYILSSSLAVYGGIHARRSLVAIGGLFCWRKQPFSSNPPSATRPRRKNKDKKADGGTMQIISRHPAFQFAIPFAMHYPRASTRRCYR
jgi:hypothetical protein